MGEQVTDIWMDRLDRVINSGQGWGESLPPYSGDGEFPSITVAKQLASEVCEFAASISDAIKRDDKTAAYANLRPLLDRFLHIVWFFEEPLAVTDWTYWSIAEINQLVSDAMSQGAVNSQDREPMRELMRSIRHWNRSEELGEDRQMDRPSRYSWNDTRKKIIGDCNPRLKGAYGIASMYVHPTYHGTNSPDPGRDYVLEQAIWITCSAHIICGATLAMLEDSPADYRINQHLLDLLEMQNDFLSHHLDFTGATGNQTEGPSAAQALHFYAAMLVKFVFGRDILNGNVPNLGTHEHHGD